LKIDNYIKDLTDEVIPFFEKHVSEICENLNNENWINFFQSFKIHFKFDEKYFLNSKKEKYQFVMRLVTNLDNHKIEDVEIEENAPKTTSVNYDGSLGNIILQLVNYLRREFVIKIVQDATARDLALYFHSQYNQYYSGLHLEEQDSHYKFELYNWDFERGLFAFSARRVNIIFPKSDSLSSNVIVDHTGGNKKILITNQMKEDCVENYTGFDEIIDINDIFIHISNFNFADSYSLISTVTRLSSKEIFNLIEKLNTTINSEIFELKKALVDIPYSKGNEFEDYVEEFLKLCFYNDFDDFNIRIQDSNEDGVRRRDFIIDNSGSTNNFLKKLENKGSDFLLFDAKNYKDKLSMSDLDTFISYIRENPYFGNTGIILSRFGIKDNAKKSLVKTLISQKIKIIVLDQNDMLNMLDLINIGKPATLLLENKYKELLLQL